MEVRHDRLRVPIAHFARSQWRRSNRRVSGPGAGHLGRDPGAFGPALHMQLVGSAGLSAGPASGDGEVRWPTGDRWVHHRVAPPCPADTPAHGRHP